MPGNNGTRQTFSTPVHGFFTGGDRKTYLEQLRHLSQWSRRVLLVTGPRGVGKSTLYRQLSASLEPRAKAARVNGALVNDAREVLNALVHGFGLAAPADAEIEFLRRVVAEHAEAQERSERFCVVLIDDADLLETRALEQVLGLAADTPLRLVLFGEVRLATAVERIAAPRDVDWHEIRLNGFAPADVQAYLEWRFRLQGHSDRLPFSDAQVKEIARLSEGLPGRVDQMANVLLAKIQSGADEDGRRRFPALHQALVAVLAVAVAFAYLVVWQPSGKSSESDWGEVQRLDVPPPPARSAPESEPAPVAGPFEGDGATAAQRPGTAPVADEDSAAAPDVPTEEHTAAAPPSSAPAVGGEKVAAASAAALSSGERPSATPMAADDNRPPAPGTRQEAVPDASAVPREAVWIMRQPASAYTLQLVSFSTAERASAYLAKQPDPASFARFRLERGGKVLHVVIYGSFDSRGAAEQAAARLPSSVGGVKPWIRTYGQIQAAARTTPQG